MSARVPVDAKGLGGKMGYVDQWRKDNNYSGTQSIPKHTSDHTILGQCVSSPDNSMYCTNRYRT